MTEDISGISLSMFYKYIRTYYIYLRALYTRSLQTAVSSCIKTLPTEVGTIRVVVLCCVPTDAMCTSTSTQQYKTDKLAATYCINERTDINVRCLLYLKMRDVYQMAFVLSSNDNDGY